MLSHRFIIVLILYCYFPAICWNAIFASFFIQFQAIEFIDDEMTSASSWQKIETTLVQLDDMAQSSYSNDRYVI